MPATRWDLFGGATNQQQHWCAKWFYMSSHLVVELLPVHTYYYYPPYLHRNNLFATTKKNHTALYTGLCSQVGHRLRHYEWWSSQQELSWMQCWKQKQGSILLSKATVLSCWIQRRMSCTITVIRSHILICLYAHIISAFSTQHTHIHTQTLISLLRENLQEREEAVIQQVREEERARSH